MLRPVLTARARRFPLAENSSSRIRWTALGIGIVLVAFIAVMAAASDEQLVVTNRVLGNPVPDVSGETLDGGTYDIADAQAEGRWTIVNFFATWCAGCVNEHPELVAFEQWGQQTGRAEIVAVVFNDPVEEVEAFFAANGGGWPVLDNPALPVEFQVSQIPETFVVNPSGRVVDHLQGEVRADYLISVIEGRFNP